MTSPSAETNEPEPPLLKRTDDFCTCSSHLSVGSNLYFSCRYLRGGLLNSNMPSPPKPPEPAASQRVLQCRAASKTLTCKTPWGGVNYGAHLKYADESIGLVPG